MTTTPVHSFHKVGLLSLAPEELSDAEKRWVTFQPYLLSKGYELRPRYRPGWVPSWKITGAKPDECEDSADSIPLRVLDATRVEDQCQVVIKILAPSDDDHEGQEELRILQHFSQPPFQDDAANHTVPALDSFPIPHTPNGTFVVMPLLSQYKYPPFYDLSEIQDFLRQIFEGLAFFHEHNVVHCDIAPPNIMMDSRPLYNEPFHPFYQNRTLDGKRPIRPKYLRSQRSVRYYYIDLGYARWFRDPTTPRMITGARARERVPEQIEGGPYDPFKGDIFQLGAVLRRDLIPKYEPLSFLLPLARDMTNMDPDKRPTLSSARHTLTSQFTGLPGWRLRWPIIPPSTPFKHRCMFILAGVTTEMVILLRRILRLLFLRH